MFYVHSPQGRLFSGSLEQFRRVNKVSPNSASRSSNSTTEYTDDVYIAQADYHVPQKNIRQYQEVLEKSGQRAAVYHAYQIMSQPVTSVEANEAIKQAYEIFDNSSFQVIPVVNERKEIIATLSRSELYYRLLKSRNLERVIHVSISDWLTSDDSRVISADPVTDARRIASMLVQENIGSIPIVEESGKLVGIVSRTDILKCVTSDPPLSMWC